MKIYDVLCPKSSDRLVVVAESKSQALEMFNNKLRYSAQLCLIDDPDFQIRLISFSDINETSINQVLWLEQIK